MQGARNLCSLALALYGMVAEVSDVRSQEGSMASRSPAIAPVQGEDVVFESNGHKLHGCVVKPIGRGPFPAVIFNHGSERDPIRCGPPALARMYQARGFLFFAFQRLGHSPSPGAYIVDVQTSIATNTSEAEYYQRVVELHESYNLDVQDAVRWIMARPDVDPRRVVMAGISYGGIQTLLTAERGLGVRAFVAFAPAAMSWRNTTLRERLKRAVERAKAPIFLAQAANDYSVGPLDTLGAIINAKDPPNLAKLYPAFGATSGLGHAGFATFPRGIAIWRDDVLGFIDHAFQQD